MEYEFVNENPKYIEDKLLAIMAERIIKDLLEGGGKIHEDRSILPS